MQLVDDKEDGRGWRGERGGHVDAGGDAGGDAGVDADGVGDAGAAAGAPGSEDGVTRGAAEAGACGDGGRERQDWETGAGYLCST